VSGPETRSDRDAPALTRLMLVDDHEVLRQGLRFMLRNETDLTVVAEAGDGEAAVALLEQARPDVVLLDLKMPGVDGLETLRRIRRRWPDLPVIVLSMYDDPEYVEEALRCGASGYLLKNVSQEELIRAVRAVRAGAGYLQAEVTRPVLERFVRTGSAPVAPHLSPRERELLPLLAEGLLNKQIARHLGVSEATVKGYLRQLFEKLGASDRAHAVALALRSRLID
jgi:DNA-binding NarL/FixJ family response regulator